MDKDLELELMDLKDRLDRMDKTVFYGLRGLVMLIDYLEIAINPMSEPEKKATALIKVREIIDTMRSTIK